ncbi:hypothetical protein TNCT_631431 [Trichonephila clavata]|uniref:Uncharacterized protein n=1 Tax=Trichonephila clavata TaxID=2740835 RepID=A0A8X6K6K4_TRICU|nr:hypothetical protein TNCT_631431 [Trichonephila clavata]
MPFSSLLTSHRLILLLDRTRLLETCFTPAFPPAQQNVPCYHPRIFFHAFFIRERWPILLEGPQPAFPTDRTMDTLDSETDMNLEMPDKERRSPSLQPVPPGIDHLGGTLRNVVFA